MKKKIVIIGGGFGGLKTAKRLDTDKFDVLLIDKSNHHLFQPLLYQVATAALSPADIAYPIRAVFSENENIKVILAEVTKINPNSNLVYTNVGSFEYDYLIVAIGARHSYFGNDNWESFAPGLKTIDDALKIRNNLLLSLEKAEVAKSVEEVRKLLTFVVVGGGPTGVEMAGAIAEIAKKTMIRDFKTIDASLTKVYLIEGGGRLLPAFDEALGVRAADDLTRMGVKVLTSTSVTDISNNGVMAGNQFIETNNIVWAAGNKVSDLMDDLQTTRDRMGRVVVQHDLSVKEYSNIFVIGDAAASLQKDGSYVPGLSPAANQQGSFVARLLNSGVEVAKRPSFSYLDKGIMATIGKAKAVVQVRELKFTGLFAWLSWCLVHIFYLIDFRNRFKVMAEWLWYYITFRQGTRLITTTNSMNEGVNREK